MNTTMKLGGAAAAACAACCAVSVVPAVMAGTSLVAIGGATTVWGLGIAALAVPVTALYFLSRRKAAPGANFQSLMASGDDCGCGSACGAAATAGTDRLHPRGIRFQGAHREHPRSRAPLASACVAHAARPHSRFCAGCYRGGARSRTQGTELLRFPCLRSERERGRRATHHHRPRLGRRRRRRAVRSLRARTRRTQAHGGGRNDTNLTILLNACRLEHLRRLRGRGPRRDRRMLRFLGVAAARQIDPVAGARRPVARALCLAADAGAEPACRQGLCGLWRHLHRGVTALALDGRRSAPRYMGSRRWPCCDPCSSDHPLRTQRRLCVTLTPVSHVRAFETARLTLTPVSHARAFEDLARSITPEFTGKTSNACYIIA